MNIAQQFQQAEQLFVDGRYQDAANMCRSIIDAQPDFAHAYYLLGALFKATGNLDGAVRFSDLAIERAPNEALFHLQKGHSLLMQGKREEAAPALKAAYAKDPANVTTLILLANIAIKDRELDAAMEYLQNAKRHSGAPEIDEHIGLCQTLKNNLPEAEAAFRAMIKSAPTLARGHVNLAKVLMDAGRRAEGEASFRDALQHDAQNHDALLALARLEDLHGNHNEAIQLARRAMQVNPGHITAYLMLGGMLITQGQHGIAADMYKKALELQPENIHAIQGYAKCLAQMGKREEAIVYIDKTLAQRPDDENMRYLRAALSGESVDTAPKEYVAKLFDEYAERFDAHLQQQLGYSTPQVIAKALHEVLKDAPENNARSLLDLGCGTGLGAEVLKEITGRRVGVDLSAKMIEKAKPKNIYDETHVADIVEFMRTSSERFDLVICVDTLVYIGNLEPFFAAAEGVLSPGGLLAVSMEEGDDAPPFVLRPTARYGHAKTYIESLARDHGLAVRHLQLTPLRQDREKMIHGYIAVFEKAGA